MDTTHRGLELHGELRPKGLDGVDTIHIGLERDFLLPLRLARFRMDIIHRSLEPTVLSSVT